MEEEDMARSSRVILPSALTMVMFVAAAMAKEPMFDLSKDKVLYCVGYAHLDTQWRWDFCTTIDKYIRDTLDQNFLRFEKFPGYTFNFTGSVRYEMMKEYYPEKYEQLKKHIAEGRWFVSGSSVDEGDVNVPSAEAIIRHVLYGNDFFRREFGKESQDFMLPDCFGFPASLPSIWAHCGLKGFSTQKLTWGSARGIPFKIGVWEGPDGNSVIAAFDPGSYASAIQGRVDLNSEWVDRVLENGRKYGVWADYHYYGVGDQGGAPLEADVQNYLASIGQPDSKIKVALVSSDQMYKDITPELKAQLPRYKGDLLLTEHSAGTLTSQAYMKRWNRKNEVLADAAERAAVVSSWLGGTAYPREALNRSWVRLLANQMHDILPGTSIPRAYTFSWNDEIVAMNGFATVLTDSVGAIARALDTEVRGVPLIVYNPLAIEREDVVEAMVTYEADPPGLVEVFDSAGNSVATQILEVREHALRILFLAKTPPLSWNVYGVRPTTCLLPFGATLSVSERQLENERYQVLLNDDGDVASILDKKAGNREMLAAPACFVFTHEKPQNWPAWNMDWADRQKPPMGRVTGPAKIRIVENGPVRVALEVEREARNSKFVQRISLSDGDAGNRVEFATTIDWQSAECALKASFPLAVSNPKATYNWGMGTIERGNNEPTKYEVPSHEWFDLTDASGQYGVSVLEDCKYGSDKPSDNELRLTLLYTPGVRYGYLDQHSQDWGRHDMTYALYGHSGDWREGRNEWQGRRLNQPLRVWQGESKNGNAAGPKSFSLLSVDTPQIDVRAVKLGEHSDRIIVRLQELWGREVKDATITLATRVLEAEEVDGQERRMGPVDIRDGKLLVSMTPYAPKSFAIKLTPPAQPMSPPRYKAVDIPFDTDAASNDGNFADGKFDLRGRSIPAEMLPSKIASGDVEFVLGSGLDGDRNAISCRGQSVELPADGAFDRVYLLAAADGDIDSRLEIGERSVPWRVQSWTGFIGQWDDRVFDRPFEEVDYKCEGKVVGFNTGYIKRDAIAWFSTHRHDPRKGNEAYRFSYLFRYGFDLRPGEHVLRLPDDSRIKVLAITVASNGNDSVQPAAPLYDDFTDRQPIELRHVYPPPEVPVHKGLDQVGTVVLDRRADAQDLRMNAPSAIDYADRSSGHDVMFRYFDGDGEYRPHRRAGAVGDGLPRLNDGLGSQNDDDISRCTWFDGEGRVFVDLQREIRITHVNTYSHHRGERAPQFFSVWGSNATEMPSPEFRHGDHGEWVLLAVVDTRELGKGGAHGSSIEPPAGQSSMGPLRYLLYVIPGGQGTFFTEIDVHAAE
jgi:alpha-mannosidase